MAFSQLTAPLSQKPLDASRRGRRLLHQTVDYRDGVFSHWTPAVAAGACFGAFRK